MLRRWLLLLGIWAWAASAWAAEVLPAKPAQYFNDYAGVVSATTAAQLNSELENFEKQTSNQVVVVVYPKMESDSSLEDYTHRLAENWQAGQTGKNNGIVLFVFVQNHRLRIEVGYGLEGALPDALAKRIEDDVIAPSFHNNDYAGGLTAGVTAIEQAVRGEYKGNGQTVAGRSNDYASVASNVFFIFVFLIFAYFRLRYFFGATVYGSTGRRIYSPGVFLGGMGGGGWGGSGGGFGGGGGFSGGGGSFGGGGASGSW